jgi:hypothetical protein
MSSLELLKTHIENINNKIKNMEKEIVERKSNIDKLFDDKEKINNLLQAEQEKYDKILHNHKYLVEVKDNTMENYNQIQESASTLLDILQNKCDGI